VPKHSRRLAGFDEAVISLYAKGLTTGEIQARLEQVYDVEVSRSLVSRVTDKVAGDLEAWRSRPLDAICAVVFIDCVYVKSRERVGGQSAALKPVYQAPSLPAAEAAFEAFAEAWGIKYPAVIKLWRSAWEAFTPFLGFPPEIRRLIYTTNAIESLGARFRQATRRRGHFPDPDAALKVLYLVIQDHRPNRKNVDGKTVGWKTVINTLTLYYEHRININS
jgi:transposase-like protein